jgi:hypothetical protein
MYTEEGKYDKNFSEYEDQTCCVCLEEFTTSTSPGNDQVMISKVKRCGHMFHTECLKKWLTSSKTILLKDPRCPLCNLSIKEAA